MNHDRCNNDLAKNKKEKENHTYINILYQSAQLPFRSQTPQDSG